MQRRSRCARAAESRREGTSITAVAVDYATTRCCSDAYANFQCADLQRHHQYQLHTSSDYNGFRPNPGAAVSFRWNSPPTPVVMDTPGPGRTPVLETREFASLADYSKATGQDRHSMLVDYDVFVNVRRLDAQDVTSLQKLYRAEDFDFRLQSGSAAVDAGVVLPTVRMALADVRRTVGQAIDDRRGPRRQPALVRRPARSGIVSRARRSGGAVRLSSSAVLAPTSLA